MLLKNISIIDENLEILRNTNVVVKKDRIAYIGNDIPDDDYTHVYDGNGKVLAPGFFNNHCHVPMTLLRGHGEGLPLQRWLTERVFPFEAKLKPVDCYWSSLLGIAEMIKSGVVSFTDMYFFIEDLAQAVEESGIKANLSHGLSFNSKRPSLFDLQGYKDTEKLIEIVGDNKTGRIKVDVGLHAEYTSKESLVREVAQYAKEKRLIIHTHLSETRSEHESCKENRGMTPAEYFDSCGLFDNQVTAAHCVWVEDNDIKLIKHKGVVPVHCPSSNMKLGSGFAPIKKMDATGISVTIGTDGASSNNNLNMIEELHLAAMINKGAELDPEFMSPSQVMKMATVNGAIAQGRADCGLVKVGNKADFVIYDFNKPHLQPVYNEISNIVFSAQAEDVFMTVIDGKVVYKNGEFKTIDLERVIYEVNSIKKRILTELEI